MHHGRATAIAAMSFCYGVNALLVLAALYDRPIGTTVVNACAGTAHLL